MHKIICNLFEIFYVDGLISVDLQIIDIQGRQVEIGLGMDSRSYILNKKIKHKDCAINYNQLLQKNTHDKRLLKIKRNISETFYIVRIVNIAVKIFDIQFKQVELGLKLPKSCFILNKKMLPVKAAMRINHHQHLII